MTIPILIVAAVVALAILLFVTEWVRYDVVGLLVLLTLTITGLITDEQALGGFSNPAVITIGSVLVLSGGLYKTGVANLVGHHVLGLAGDSQVRLIFLMMASAGVLSGLMNNIAVGALFLPLVLDIARRTNQAPSRLLMPLAFATLLGGLLTLIGTAPNILISGHLEQAGLGPFRMFDFTPLGVLILLTGIVYMASVGRHLLPSIEAGVTSRARSIDVRALYDLKGTLFCVTIPGESRLSGSTLAETRLGVALGLSVLAIRRNGVKQLAPEPHVLLRGGDELVVHGRIDALESLQSWKRLTRPNQRLPITADLVSESVALGELEVAPGSSACGHTVADLDLRALFGVTIIAIARGDRLSRSRLQAIPLEEDDTLLVIGHADRIQALSEQDDFGAFHVIDSEEATRKYRIDERLLRLRVPEDSELAGLSLAESRLGDALGLTVLEIARDGGKVVLPYPDTMLEAGDDLLIAGRREELELLDSLQDLRIEPTCPDVEELESEEFAFAEATLAPRATLLGKNLRDLFFREKYGLTVVAISRGGRRHHSNLRVRSMKLRLGDAFLLYGPRRKLAILAQDPMVLVLTSDALDVYRSGRAPLAGGIMAAVVLSVATGLLPIQIATPCGAVLMVLTGCLTAEEAYEFIEWKVLILIAGMLGLGLAIQESGVAGIVGENLIGSLAAFGPRAVVAGLLVVTAGAAQIMPTAAVAVLMSPIALTSALELGYSPQAMMMVIAVGSSCALLSPVGHPVNLLVMGLGGYRFTDYAKAGAGLFVAILTVTLLVLTVLWPIVP
jgi:di/tricarboxylate transporter